MARNLFLVNGVHNLNTIYVISGNPIYKLEKWEIIESNYTFELYLNDIFNISKISLDKNTINNDLTGIKFIEKIYNIMVEKNHFDIKWYIHTVDYDERILLKNKLDELSLKLF